MSIQSEISRLQTAKTNLATAIASKGVTVPDTATLDDYPALVSAIQTGVQADPLEGKRIVLFGDSWMSGLGWAGGIGNCLQEYHPNTTFTNVSVEGACIADTSGSYPLIFNQMVNNISSFEQGDIFIFDGGGNDIGNNIPTGEMPTTIELPSGNIKTELYPAFQQTLWNLIQNGPSKDFYYIIPQLYATANGVSTETASAKFDNLYKICKFFGIRVIDLRSNAGFSTTVTASKSMYMYDDLHPNEAGYRKMAPYINNRIMSYY